ncbi:hypothetical protein AVEN_254421-1 [Araneus ventricosus]|uniref:Uncharacterized protein n=1 Tax=Araneus ventricosus TaxID=182803 RepID=A0A4Y2M7N3_ARAVE|nr:hypothetical protein AVEN_254421-1 [Araneus ventricosus]
MRPEGRRPQIHISAHNGEDSDPTKTRMHRFDFAKEIKNSYQHTEFLVRRPSPTTRCATPFARGNSSDGCYRFVEKTLGVWNARPPDRLESETRALCQGRFRSVERVRSTPRATTHS